MVQCTMNSYLAGAEDMEHSGLYLGTAYYIEAVTQEEIPRDLEYMAQAGINFLRVGEKSWPFWEPEQGQYDFSRLHDFLRLCQKKGFSVVITLPSDKCPGWLAGEALNSPGFRKSNDRLIQRLTQVTGAFSCVTGYQVDAVCDNGVLAQHQCNLIKQLLGQECYVIGLENRRCTDALPGSENWNAVGCTLYHKTGLKNNGSDLTFLGDLARAGRQEPYIVLETQCQGKLGELPYPGQLRLSAFHHIASGAGGICYRTWHSDTQAGSDRKGVVGYDGLPGRAYREVSRIGQEFQILCRHLSGLKKCCRAAVVVSPKSAALMPQLGGKTYTDYLRWICDGFYRLNIELDLLPDTCRDFSDYALVVTPCLYSAEDDLITALRNFVAEGGNLISTFRSFFADGQGNIRKDIQPYGMTDVFGMCYEDFTVPEETCLPEYMAEVSGFMELLELRGAMSLAIYDSPAWRGVPAASCCRFGKGQAAYFGCYSEEGFEPILLRLLAMWHIPVPETSWPVVQKRAISREGKPLTFLLHYSPASRVISSPATGTELFSGIHLDEGEPLELKGWDVKILEGDL